LVKQVRTRVQTCPGVEYNGPRKLDHGISKLWEREGLKREE
jgi:hypothetical protein